MGQKGAPRRPAARRFRAQRDGCRGLDSVVPAGLLRQRRLAPIGAGALHAPRRQVEPGGLEQLHTERVHEGARGYSPGRGGGRRGARPIRDRYGEPEARRPVVERERASRVGPPPHDGVHLPGAGPRVPGKRPRRRREPAPLVSVNLFFTSFAKQARRSRKGGFTGCANVFSPIPVTAWRGRPSAGPSACRTCRLS